MHVLHRPDPLRAMAVTLIAAALAVVLTLALAASLSDLGSTQGPASTVSAARAPHTAATSPNWVTSPFSRLPSSPLAVPRNPAQP